MTTHFHQKEKDILFWCIRVAFGCINLALISIYQLKEVPDGTKRITETASPADFADERRYLLQIIRSGLYQWGYNSKLPDIDVFKLIVCQKIPGFDVEN